MIRCRSFLRALWTQSARMNSLSNWSLQMPGFNLPLNLPPNVSMGCLPFIYVANCQENVISGTIWGFPNALDPEHIRYGSLEYETPRTIPIAAIKS